MKPFRFIPSSHTLLALACAVFGSVFCARIQGAPPPPAPAPHKFTQQPSSTSGSGQFIVHGSDLGTRSAFCLLCDDTSAALGRLLRDNGRYAIPVVVVLKSAPDVDRTGPAISTNISQLAHGGFHLQINAQLRADFQSDEFARELVRVLLAERILRNHAELKTNRERVLPDWALTGVTQALEFRARSRPSALFTAVFRGGQVFSVDKILTADPQQLDALSRTIYETSSCAIVLALLEQQDGPVRFGRFLNALALDNKTDRELLKEHFPTLGVSKNSLEKWWTLQMATLATPSALESMTISQTEEKLDEALTLRYDPLPEKKKKGRGGKEKEEPKSAEAAPENEGYSFDGFAMLETPILFRSISDLLDALMGGTEVVAVPAKDADADDKTGKKTRKKSAGKEPEEAAKEDSKRASKTPEKKEAGKKAAPQKEPEKKSPEKEPEKKQDEKIPELRARPHRIAQRPQGVPAPTPEEKTKAEPKTKEKEKDKPAPAEVAKTKETKPAAEEDTTPKKRSRWNPANWFRGKDDKPAPETAKKETEPSVRPKSGAKPDSKVESVAVGKSGQGTLQDYPAIWKRPDRTDILRRNLDQLNALKNQSHPLYRPLIEEYSAVVRQLMVGKDRGMKEKLASLHDRHAKISSQSKSVESYLDWYAASETQNYSGTFDDYLKLRDKLKKNIRPRGDAISQYLDSLEKEYEN